MTLIRIGDKEAMLDAMRKLVRLDPHNPTVFGDLLAYASGGPVTNVHVLSILDGLKKDYHNDHLVHANCDFYSGKILIETDPTAARGYFAAA